MVKYKVDLLSMGGSRIAPIIVEASTGDKAKELAVLMANAQAKAKGSSSVYRATSVSRVY
jgi:hypothetical protein